MVKHREGGYVSWLSIGRGICFMVKNRKRGYVPWLRIEGSICSMAKDRKVADMFHC